MSEKKFYITTPIYYVNAAPHIGSLYSTLLADIIARFNKINGKEVMFVTGTDEHGQKVAEAALQANQNPKEFVDNLIPAFQNTWKEWNLSYDHFIRTTDTYHIRSVQNWIRRMMANGNIYKARYEGWYSSSSEAFLTEKDIECRNEDGTPICPISKKPAIWLSEEAYFFRLSEYQGRLLDFYQENPNFIKPEARIQEVISFVKSGLKDLCISRSRKNLTWGIPFPDDTEHVVYVWADALNNYITAIGYGDNLKIKEFHESWPADVHVLGKDIVRFHAVFWPAFLMATGLPLPKHLLVHGWILVDNQKMSKSLGNVISPEYLAKTYGIERSRYYLARYMVTTQDCSFNHQDLIEKTNTDLCDTLGNLIQRIMSLADKNLYKTMEPSVNEKIYNVFKEHLDQILNDMNEFMVHKAYTNLWAFINTINKYIQESAPWKSAKNNKKDFEETVSTALHAIYAIAVLIWPIMPKTAEIILSQIGHRTEHPLIKDILQWKQTFIINKTENLFSKLEYQTEVIDEQNADTNSLVSIQELQKIEIRVGKIIAIEEIPKSDKLYKLTVSFGSFGTRIICAGIREYFKPEELLNIKTTFAYNLAPRTLRGIKSHGMTMMAKNKDRKPTLVQVNDSVVEGELLS